MCFDLKRNYFKKLVFKASERNYKKKIPIFYQNIKSEKKLESKNTCLEAQKYL